MDRAQIGIDFKIDSSETDKAIWDDLQQLANERRCSLAEASRMRLAASIGVDASTSHSVQPAPHTVPQELTQIVSLLHETVRALHALSQQVAALQSAGVTVAMSAAPSAPSIHDDGFGFDEANIPKKAVTLAKGSYRPGSTLEQ